MENIASRLITSSSQKNLTESFIAHLYKSKSFSIGQALVLNECEVLGTNLINEETTKSKIKEYVMANNDVVVYLNVNLEEIESTKIIKSPPSYTSTNLVPFVCVGWSDYDYLTSIVKGKKIRNRGYFILHPITSSFEEENFYYLPYKFFKSEENEEESLIREAWCFRDITKAIIPKRSTIEMHIGDRIFKDSNTHYETDAVPFYGPKGNPLIPLRTIAQRLGYAVSWNKRKKLVTLTKPDTTTILIEVGKTHCIKDGKTILFSVPVYINKHNKRTYVSLGFVKSVLGCHGEFVKKREIIKIFRNS